MKLLETQFAARLRLGDAGDVIGELEAAVATYPFQESLWELLITALYRAGRQADALATYQRVRTQLADELGLDPGPQLQQLEQRILVQDPSLDAPGRAGERRAARRGREPAVAVGRARRPRGGDRRRCPTCSPASGSSRSSGRAASGRRRSRSRPAARLASSTARSAASGWPGSRRATHGRRRPRRADRARSTSRRRGGAVRAAQGRRRAGDPRQLRARRRRRRGARGPPPRRRPRAADPVHQPGPARRRRRGRVRARAAGALRRRRAVHPPRHGATPEPRRERGRRRVLDLCRSLDGLPLAIELAAARTRTLSIEEITRRLDDRFSVLSDPTSRRPERRRALQVDDRLELRAAVPRRPAGPVGAGHVRRRRAAAGGRVRPRSARRAGGRGDRRGRPAREPVARDRRRRGAGGRSATGCSTASARSRSKRWPTPG